MTDPERLLQAEGGGLSSALLRAGRAEGPSEKLLGDTLLAVGVGAAGVAAGALAAGSGSAVLKAGGTTGLTTLAIKWLGIGAVSGVVTVGATIGVVQGLNPAPKPQAAVAAPALVVAAPAPIRASPGVAPEAPAPVEAISAPPRRSTVAPALEAPLPSITDETRAVDQARRELREGNLGQALATLDRYDRLPGPHRLQQEALLLRMDALVRSGNPHAARVVAKRLLDQSPSGPHAARARQVLGDKD